MSSDGTRVAIGATGNDGTGTTAGHVRVYAESGGTWTQVGADIDGEAADDSSGYVGIDVLGRHARGDRRDWNDGTGTDAGHVRVYAESGGTWTQVGCGHRRRGCGRLAGHSVSMSSDGTRVAIGAYGNDGGGTGLNAGHVRVYAESGGTWTQVGSDIDGEAADDFSGYSVSMSSDGTRVAIGAKGSDNDVGHVRVYAESGGTWNQVGADIDGDAAGNGHFGWTVSMSSDGTRVAIGAPYHDNIRGHVRVYEDGSVDEVCACSGVVEYRLDHDPGLWFRDSKTCHTPDACVCGEQDGEDGIAPLAFPPVCYCHAG